MNTKKILLLSLICAASSCLSGAAKKESVPDLRPIPGHVVDHMGICVNPVPQKVEFPNNGFLNISGGFRLADSDDGMEKLLSGLKVSEYGIPLRINYGNGSADKGVCQKSGAYRLSIGPESIEITGFDEAGAFYGVATLRQLVEYAESVGDGIPMAEIDDYPELNYRGVVEGFYGRPWTHETRLSLIDFMGRHKMNSYVYGPKDDPYHRTPDWRKPYPAEEGSRIRELADRCRRNHIDFVWAIHPGGDIRWNKEDRDSLLQKFEAMYELGVRQFAIFFDDISGDGTDSRKQTALLNDIRRDFVEKKGDVGNLIVCPTDYNMGWANPSEHGQLAVYGRELDPEIEVFWTGKVVCGDIEPEAMEFVNSRIQRPALVWWNFPVTDYCRKNLLMGPVYGLDTTLSAKNMAGIETNPMENGEASKGAIYGVADYSWNPSAYNALDNWTRSFSEIMPGAPADYAVFAIHSADPPKNYRRNESWNVDTFRYDDYTQEQFDRLRNEFEKIRTAPDNMFARGGNTPLVVEIAPWLVEFSNLGQRGLDALDLIKIYESGNREKFKEAYTRLRLMNKIQRPGYLAHRSGTLKLQPFVDNVISDLESYFNSL